MVKDNRTSWDDFIALTPKGGGKQVADSWRRVGLAEGLASQSWVAGLRHT